MLEIVGTIKEYYSFREMQNYYGGLTIFCTEDSYYWSMGSITGESVGQISEELWTLLKEQSDGEPQGGLDKLDLVSGIVKGYAPEDMSVMVDEIVCSPLWEDGHSEKAKGISPFFSIRKVAGHVIVNYSDKSLNLWVIVEDAC